MVYCVTARLAFSSAARRDAVLADIQTRVTGRPRWGIDVLEAGTLRFGEFGIRAELRFSTRADQEQLRTRIESFATGQRAPLAGSWLTLHDCTHDEGTNGCLVVARRDW
jgi:hypothetical protein